MADNLLQKALKNEESEFGARPEHMADLFQAIGTNKDEIQKLTSFVEDCHSPDYMTIIEYFEKSTAIRKTLAGDKHKIEVGNMLNRTAYYYAEVSDRGGYEELTAEEATQLARDKVDEAVTLFTKLGDEAKIADCLISKGITFTRGDSHQIKYYKDAQQMLLRTVGEIHHTMARVYINSGVYYEDAGNYNEAFANFYKHHLLMVQLYGENHPKLSRSVETLNEPFYARICKRKGIQVLEIATKPVQSKTSDPHKLP